MKTPKTDNHDELWEVFSKAKTLNKNLNFGVWHDENTILKSNKHFYWYEVKEIQQEQLILF